VSQIFTVVPKCPMDTVAPVLKRIGSEVYIHHSVGCTADYAPIICRFYRFRNCAYIFCLFLLKSLSFKEQYTTS